MKIVILGKFKILEEPMNTKSGTDSATSKYPKYIVNYFSLLSCIIISPGGNTQQSTNYTDTCLPLRKLSKLDKPDMQDTAGEAGTSS